MNDKITRVTAVLQDRDTFREREATLISKIGTEKVTLLWNASRVPTDKLARYSALQCTILTENWLPIRFTVYRYNKTETKDLTGCRGFRWNTILGALSTRMYQKNVGGFSRGHGREYKKPNYGGSSYTGAANRVNGCRIYHKLAGDIIRLPNNSSHCSFMAPGSDIDNKLQEIYNSKRSTEDQKDKSDNAR